MVRQDVLRIIPSDGVVIGSVGCGRGEQRPLWSTKGRIVHEVDVSKEAIRTAGKRLLTERLLSADECLPFESASLDGLILAGVIEHMPPWRGSDCID